MLFATWFTCVYYSFVCACVLSRFMCPTFCDPVDRSLPGSSVHGDSPGENTGVGCHAHSSELLYDPAIPLLGIYPLQKIYADSNRMGKSKDLFKKIRDTKGIFHAKMNTMKNRNKELDMTGQLNWTEYSWQHYSQLLRNGSNLSVHQ